MKRMLLATGISVLALGMAGLSLQAADVYVKAGAEGKGSKDAPYGEIWKALDKANRGDGTAAWPWPTPPP